MKKNILLVYVNYSSFVKTDYEILSKKYEVSTYHYKPVRGICKNTIEFSRQLYHLLINIKKYSAIYIWFGDYHSFLPVLFGKLFRKKTLVVIGGYDVAYLPQYGYGTMTKPLRKLLTRFSFRHATVCIPVAEGLEKQLIKICPKAKSQTISTGYKFNLSQNYDFHTHRENIILTVSITGNHQRYMIKGLDRFRELAQQLPNYKFYIIGVEKSAQKLFAPCPSNLNLIPPLKANELVEYYLNASYYAQFSRSEGLPNALCEAMLYGCVPLGTNVGGIRHATGNFGLILNEWEPKKILQYISDIDPKMDRKLISESIVSRFDQDKRTSTILNTVEKLL